MLIPRIRAKGRSSGFNLVDLVQKDTLRIRNCRASVLTAQASQETAAMDAIAAAHGVVMV